MSQFNLRVYAFIINDKHEVLLSDEYEFGTFFTKFPGGGVKYGEGFYSWKHGTKELIVSDKFKN